jgi:hypothetical protein
VKRFQVDIKSNHQPAVQELMQKLGGVSGADAIGFLIETQISAALARLEPTFRIDESVTKTVKTVQPITSTYEPVSNPVSNPVPQRQQRKADIPTQTNEATEALSMLLGN